MGSFTQHFVLLNDAILVSIEPRPGYDVVLRAVTITLFRAAINSKTFTVLPITVIPRYQTKRYSRSFSRLSVTPEAGEL